MEREQAERTEISSLINKQPLISSLFPLLAPARLGDQRAARISSYSHALAKDQ